MSFALNNTQQISFFDRFNNLTEREQKFIRKSWANTFADRIFPLIDEEKFSVLFCENNGRPNAPVNVVIGSLIIKEMFGLTDEELVESVVLDMRFQYALHLTSFSDVPYSDRTPSRFRERLLKYEMETGIDLLKSEIERLGEEFAEILNINSNIKRMDSVMFSSNCKKMSRLELVYTCTRNLIKLIDATGETLELSSHLLKYLDESDKNSVCYRLTNDEVSVRLESILKDAQEVHSLCDEAYFEFEEYKLLKRMLDEQTDNGTLKEGKDIKSSCLQNPSDPDATFRKKAGKNHTGYTANFVEDCSENGNIITSYDVEQNTYSDVQFASDVIDKLGEQSEETVLIADGAYASSENFNSANDNNINLVTTNLTGVAPNKVILDFEINDGNIECCPAGHAPIDCAYDEENGKYRAHFDNATCSTCPFCEQCPSKEQKKSSVVIITDKAIERAEYVEKLANDEYKEYAKIRNGVEGIPSVLRRRYGLDYMPVRGLLRTKLWFGLKIGAINAKRVIAAFAYTKLSCIIFVFREILDFVLYFLGKLGIGSVASKTKIGVLT